MSLVRCDCCWRPIDTDVDAECFNMWGDSVDPAESDFEFALCARCREGESDIAQKRRAAEERNA